MEILFEDEHVIAVNKPSGIPSNTLADSSVDHPSVEETLKRLRAPNPVFLLHRLDVGTSGVLLFARSEQAYEKMRDLFRLKQITKRYWAWSEYETTSPLPIEIKKEIAHHSKSKKRMIVVDPIKMGKRPQTFYRGNPMPAFTRILSYSPSEWSGKSAFRYEVEIITGVMHQIRVHLKSMDLPLLGDSIYGEPHTEVRLGLHAHFVSFELFDFEYRIEAPLR